MMEIINWIICITTIFLIIFNIILFQHTFNIGNPWKKKCLEPPHESFRLVIIMVWTSSFKYYLGEL